MPAAWRRVGEVRHVFTHFALTLTVHAAEVRSIHADGFLVPAAHVAQEALPSVMMKCVRLIRPRSARTMRG
jgi:A/G-specific adenine glycosylase